MHVHSCGLQTQSLYWGYTEVYEVNFDKIFWKIVYSTLLLVNLISEVSDSLSADGVHDQNCHIIQSQSIKL